MAFRDHSCKHERQPFFAVTKRTKDHLHDTHSSILFVTKGNFNRQNLLPPTQHEAIWGKSMQTYRYIELRKTITLQENITSNSKLNIPNLVKFFV